MSKLVAILVTSLLTTSLCAQVNIRVTNEPLNGGAAINQMQYGQFIEFLCDLVPGMWAEKLYDTGFEGLSPYKFEFIKQTDFKEKRWHPCGAVNRAKYELDRESKVGGDTSQRIVVGDGPPTTVGIEQDGIFADAGKALHFACWLRCARSKQAVRIAIHRDGESLTDAEFEATGEWNKFSTTWTPAKKIDNATLSIWFRGPGTIWIDNASLMPADTVNGWRPDVVAALRELKPGVIRFGGSAVEGGDLGDLEWKDLIGDPDRRKAFRAWGGLQPQGVGVEEFVQLCRAVDAEPLICVRFSKRTPKDAADEVEYFNGSTDAPMGAVRAKNGHAEPYHVKLWQIGNEIGGDDYANRVGAFARAMKKVDSSIEILSSFPNPKFIANAGDVIDYVCPHHYSRDFAGEERDIVNIATMIQDNAPPGRADKIKIGITEWNTTGGDMGLRRAALWSLENALSIARYHNMLHRHADIVQIANRSNLTNSFCSGIIQTDHAGRLYKTPTYYAQQLYATQGQAIALKLDGETGGLDVSATTSRDRRAMAIFVVNPTAAVVAAKTDVSAVVKSADEVKVLTLADRDSAGEPDAANSFDDPQRIGVTQSNIGLTGGKLIHDFPAYSLTVVRCVPRS